MCKQIYQLVFVSLLSLIAAAHAENTGNSFTRADLATAASLRERALADSTAYQLVESLTTEVGPRPAGSPGDRAAVA